MSSVKLYDPTNETWIGDLTVDVEGGGGTWGPLDATAPDQINQINTCKVTVPLAHPLIDDLVFPNVLRFYDGASPDPFNAAVIMQRGDVEVDAEGELTRELTAMTLESVLDRMLVRGWVTDPLVEPQADARAYNAAAPTFDISDLDQVTHEMTRATSTPQRPLAWPDPYTAAVWTQAEGPHPVGPVWIIRDFYLDVEEPTQVVFFYSGDDEAQVWVDTCRVANQQPVHPSDVWHHTWKVAVLLPPGWHRFALRGYNFAATGPGALWASAWRTNGVVVGDPIFVTGAVDGNPWIGDWRQIAYPAADPGATPGLQIGSMVTDAQADGCCPTLVCDFDEYEDSNGEAWPIVSGYAPLLDQSIWAATSPLRERWVDLRMDPGNGLTLRAYNKGSLGEISTEAIVAGDGGNLTWLKRTTKGLV